MLERPALQEKKIRFCLKSEYGLDVSQIEFLPLGADPNSAVYRVVAKSGDEFFLKLRSGNFDEASLAVPRFLMDHWMDQVIAPIATDDHKLSTALETFTLILYPFIAGRNAIDVALSELQWAEFGAALKVVHTVAIPPELKHLLHQEEYSSKGRETVKGFLKRIKNETFSDPLAVDVTRYLKIKHDEVLRLVDRTETLESVLRKRGLEFVLCHTDIFAANLLIDSSGKCYLVDWDNPLLAPKERDLMYIGAGICDVWNTPSESELFYKGYGHTEIDPIALVYYRYERIIQDIAVISDAIFLTDEGGADREREFEFLKSNFVPGGVLEIAYETDKELLANSEF